MASTTQHCDILIVGSGVFGLTAAIELKARHKSLKVTVLDPGPVPHRHAASTDISKVIRMDYGSDEIYVEMMEDCFPIWRKWNEEWNEQIYFETGLVAVVGAMGSDSYEMETVNTLRKRGHPIDLMDQVEFGKRFPSWAGSPVGYFNKTGGWARSGRVVEHLNRIAIASGVNVQLGTMNRLLLKPVVGKDLVTVCEGIVTKDDIIIRAPTVIVAAGASTPSLVPQVKHMMWPTAQPVFHLAIEHPERFPVEEFPVFFSGISQSGFYGFPIIEESLSSKIAPRKKIPGSAPPSWHLENSYRLKVGQHGAGWKIDEINDETLAALWEKVGPGNEKLIRNWLSLTLPQLKTADVVYTRLCIYCDTFDGDFLIDRVPNVDGLVIASGGSGHGFKFTPILGNIIADVVDNKPNKYKSRFAWRPVTIGRKEAARNLTSPTTLLTASL